ncbi:hypothetical protein D3C85_1384120 [compost metagenome]
MPVRTRVFNGRAGSSSEAIIAAYAAATWCAVEVVPGRSARVIGPELSAVANAVAAEIVEVAAPTPKIDCCSTESV